MALDVVMNEYVQSIIKAMRSKSPVEGPRTRIEPTNGSRQQLTDDIDVQTLWTNRYIN